MTEFVRQCHPGPYTEALLNLHCYRATELPWFFIGCGLWAVVYAIVIYRGFKYRWVEMPAMAAAANIAWEFSWSFVNHTNMGRLAVVTYHLWFFMDIAIFSLVWRYGHKQGFAEPFIRVFKPMFLASTLAWTALCILYVRSGYTDHHIGAISAYSINIVLSASYLFQLARLSDTTVLSPWVAWLKMIGTGMNTVFMFIVFPKDHFLLAMGVIVWGLDMTYIFFLHSRQSLAAAHGPGALRPDPAHVG